MPTYELKIGELGEMKQPLTIASLRNHRDWIRALQMIYPDAKVELISQARGKGEVTARRLNPAPTWKRKK